MEQIITRLRESEAALAKELAGINEAQWKWRCEDGRWTVQENVEHLILVERGVTFLIHRALHTVDAAPAEPLTDDQVWDRLTGPNRGRGEAPERVRPTGKWGEMAAATAELKNLRGETIAYAASTADPLRERWLRLPVGDLDGAQALLMLAGHSIRHLEQIRALRAEPGFPE